MALNADGGAYSWHFSDEELRSKEPGGKNLCKQALVDALEALRASIGGIPIIVDSAYRSPERNAATPNAVKNSQHMEGTAADIRIPGWTAAQLEAAARKIPAIKGIGRNDHENYLHIDVRETPAEWAYNAQGQQEPYYPAKVNEEMLG